jgi:serine/threonine protein kinase
MGGYRIIRRLGAGGMGEVFLARSESVAGVARPCVLKTIHARHDGDQGARNRFIHEARLTIQLAHKNLCGVTHVGEDDGVLFLAMDFVAGRDLRDVLARLHEHGRRLPTTIALYILREMLDGLDYAHRAVDVATGTPLQLVHRDLTPSNVMISIEGEVKIIDFGQAKSTLKSERTETGSVFGTLPYLSPEQARGESIDQRSDLYTLGVLATELFAGVRYFVDLPREEVRALVPRGHRSPLLDTLDSDVRSMLESALAPDRHRRTVTAEELRSRVDRLLVGRGAIVGPGDLRRLLEELFPGEMARQRAILGEAAGLPATTESPGATRDHLPAHDDGSGRIRAPSLRAPPSDGRPRPGSLDPPMGGVPPVTELIPTGVLRARSRGDDLSKRNPDQRRERRILIAAVVGLALVATAIGARLLVGANDAATPSPVLSTTAGPTAAGVGAVVAVGKNVDAGAVGNNVDAGTVGGAVDAGSSFPAADRIDVDRIDVDRVDAGSPTADAGVVVVRPAVPRPGRPVMPTAPPRPKAPPSLRTTADKLAFLGRCPQRCARVVLDKHARFATLSVDEARGLAAELDACVQRCGG